MKSPFENDPFSIAWQAFKNLYPEKECECYIDFPDSEDAYGCTYFSDHEIPVVVVSPELTIADAIEIFVHELAHVVCGPDEHHSPVWETVFDRIHEEYDNVGNEMFSDGNKIEVVDGKAYVMQDET